MHVLGFAATNTQPQSLKLIIVIVMEMGTGMLGPWLPLAANDTHMAASCQEDKVSSGGGCRLAVGHPSREPPKTTAGYLFLHHCPMVGTPLVVRRAY